MSLLVFVSSLFFDFVPMCLCSFVPSLLRFHAAEDHKDGFLRRPDAFLLSLEIEMALHLLEKIQARPADTLAQDHLAFRLQ